MGSVNAPNRFTGVDNLTQDWLFNVTDAVGVGDIMWNAGSDVARPADKITAKGSTALNQAYLAARFVGLTQQAILAVETLATKRFTIRTEGKATFPCASATFTRGTIVGVDCAAGVCLANQVIALADQTVTTSGIGVVTKDYLTATTSVEIYFVARVGTMFQLLAQTSLASFLAADITGNDSSLAITGLAGTTSAGGAIPITGGAGDGTTNLGGAVSLTGGVGAVTGAGGAASLIGGSGGATSGAGGAVTITGGAGILTGVGGVLTGASGAGGTALTSGTGAAGGALSWTSGAGGGTVTGTAGASGTLTLASGAGGAASGAGTGGATTTSTGGAGAAITITAGAGGAASGAGTSGVGGAITLTGGASGTNAAGTGAAGGAITLVGGLGVGAAAGGAVAITSGAAGATGIAGAITITVGGATAGAGSNLTCTAGNGAGGTAAGGNVNLIPGTAVSTGVPGEFQVASTAGTMEATWQQSTVAAVPVSGANYVILLARRAWRVKACAIVCSSTSTVPTVDVQKDTGTTAPGSGTTVLTGVMTFSATANTVVLGTLVSTVATLTLAAGDRLTVKFAGTVGSIINAIVSVLLVPC